MSVLRILHVIPAVAQRYGGPSQVIFEMCRALNERGVETSIATSDADGSGRLSVQLGRTIDYQGVPTIFFQRRWSRRFGYSPALARWLDSHVAGFDAVHIHAVFSHPCIAAARACRKHRVPYIVRPLGSLDPWSMQQRALLKNTMWHCGVRRMLRSAAALHYTMDEERRLAESSLGLQNGVVVPLGVAASPQERDGGESFQQRQPLLADRPYILTLSRLHPKKNIEMLVEAFLSLAGRSEYERWRLVIAGDGEAEYVNALRLLSRQKGGDGKVIFAGWLDGPGKASALLNAALLALPSRQENFGLAAAEALAYGVPVLVSDHVNLAPEIKRSVAGWVTSLDPERFASTLAHALRDESECRRRGSAGREFALKQLSWTNVSEKLLGLYAAVVAAGPNSEAGRPGRLRTSETTPCSTVTPGQTPN